jgi:hypothetical protein
MSRHFREAIRSSRLIGLAARSGCARPCAGVVRRSGATSPASSSSNGARSAGRSSLYMFIAT